MADKELTAFDRLIEEQAAVLHEVGNDLIDWCYDSSNQSWSPYHAAAARAEAAVQRLKELLAGKGA